MHERACVCVCVCVCVCKSNWKIFQQNSRRHSRKNVYKSDNYQILNKEVGFLEFYVV